MDAMENEKRKILQMLREEVDLWDELLSGLSEEQITRPVPNSQWSIKDELAHLWAWQQITAARMEAAAHDREPEFPEWPERLGPDPEEDVDQTNAWIYDTYRDKPWPNLYADWRGQFLRVIELAQQIPASSLLDPAKYPWMKGYDLYAALQGSYEHHEEHLERLAAGSNGESEE